MIIAWMAYATVLAGLAWVGALAAERVVAIWRGGRRFVWLAALGAGAVAPVVLAVRADPQGDHVPISSVNARSGTVAGTRSSDLSAITTGAANRLLGAAMVVRITHALVIADPFVRRAWVLVSGILLVLSLGAMGRLRFWQRRWREHELDGDQVLIAPDLGPAVVGVVAPRVVIPEWALSLDRPSRTLMLRHEDEHIRAGDPQLLFVAALALMLFPWNAALWFVVGRLRLAIEVDCDGRVLLESQESRSYGMLLLAVCARRTLPLPFAASLAEHTSHIERRIMAMSAERARRPILASVVGVAFTLVMGAMACYAPRPGGLRAATPVPYRGLLTLPRVVVSSPLPAEQPHAVVLGDTQPQRAPRAQAMTTRSDSGPKLKSFEELRLLLGEHLPGILSADSTSRYYVTVVFDSSGKFVWSVAVKGSFYMFRLDRSPSGAPQLTLQDGQDTPLGVFDSFLDVDVQGGKLTPSVAALKLIFLK